MSSQLQQTKANNLSMILLTKTIHLHRFIALEKLNPIVVLSSFWWQDLLALVKMTLSSVCRFSYNLWFNQLPRTKRFTSLFIKSMQWKPITRWYYSREILSILPQNSTLESHTGKRSHAITEGTVSPSSVCFCLLLHTSPILLCLFFFLISYLLSSTFRLLRGFDSFHHSSSTINFI